MFSCCRRAILGLIAAHVYLFPQSRRGWSAERRSNQPATSDGAVLSAPGVDGYGGGVAHDLCARVYSHIFLPRSSGRKQTRPTPNMSRARNGFTCPIFQWLKYFKGSLAIVGIVVIPTLTAILIVALPFIRPAFGTAAVATAVCRRHLSGNHGDAHRLRMAEQARGSS